jgi:YggT family protein
MSSVIRVLSLIFQAYEFLILIRVILSWVNVNPYQPAVRILYQITDPVLEPLRKLIPPIGGMLDISPVVALILLEILHRVLVTLLAGI